MEDILASQMVEIGSIKPDKVKPEDAYRLKFLRRNKRSPAELRSTSRSYDNNCPGGKPQQWHVLFRSCSDSPLNQLLLVSLHQQNRVRGVAAFPARRCQFWNKPKPGSSQETGRHNVQTSCCDDETSQQATRKYNGQEGHAGSKS